MAKEIETKKTPLLELTTRKINRYVEIEDEGKVYKYNYIDFNGLGIVQSQEIANLGKTLTKVSSIKTQVEEKQCNEKLLDLLCLILPSAPRKILLKFGIIDRLKIATKFFEINNLFKKKQIQLTKGSRAKKKKRR